jgi:AcrR family transcriptional regulator
VALEGFGMLETALTDAVESTEARGPVERLQALGVAYVTFALRHRAHFEVMFRPELLRPDDPELHHASLATFGVLREAARAARDDGFGPGWDADDLALTAWALVHGIVQLTSHGVLSQVGFPVGAVELTARLTSLVGEVIASVGQR